MTGEVFSYVPSKSFTKETKPRISTAQFGSGYSQTVAYGINNIDISWKLSFVNQSISTANAIVAFLTARGGSEYFLFTPPGEVTQYKVICQEWSEEYTSHISRTINATFVRSFNLI